jgi:transcriptional regulator with XRE-family HTH domain
MPESFGARLRQRREERNIALATIADQTKIKLSLLEALERDDVSQWPSGIFRRAYIRAYADSIGLNPDAVVREFLEVHPEPREVVATAWPMAPTGDNAPIGGGPGARLRGFVGSALGSFSRRRRSHAVDVPTAPEDAPIDAPAAPPPASDRSIVAPATAPPPPAPSHVDRPKPIGDRPLTNRPPASPDLAAVARLCTELGRVASAAEMHPLLQEAARLLDATGLIVWLWDASAGELRPALAHGYSDKVLAQLPIVRRDADNATAAAFRSAQTCAIEGTDQINGALVVPLLTSTGCAGVLALELQHGGERARSVRAAATILAAVLALLVGGGPSS